MRFTRPCLQQARRAISDVFSHGDFCLLTSAKGSYKPVLTQALAPETKTSTPWGAIAHDLIVGQRPRDFVTAPSGRHLRLSYPTLDEYVTCAPRLVTPVYPADAAVITSLLDMHIVPCSRTERHFTPYEILEAGTGHGSLTLHLARVLHGGNPPISEPVRQRLVDLMDDDADVTMYRGHRAAIVHSVEANENVSTHARKMVHNFRKGIYAPSIDFHVNDVSVWVAQQLKTRQEATGASTTEPFLEHAVLDMPDPNHHLEMISSALHVNGSIVVWCPSITQLQICHETVRELRLPLHMERVVELAAGWTGGREWDLRPTYVRARKRRATAQHLQTNVSEDLQTNVLEDSQIPPPEDSGAENSDTVSPERDDLASSSLETQDEAADDSLDEPSVPDSSPASTNSGSQSPASSAATASSRNGFDLKEVWICRPKPFERVRGGGFVGLWRKKSPPPPAETTSPSPDVTDGIKEVED